MAAAEYLVVWRILSKYELILCRTAKQPLVVICFDIYMFIHWHLSCTALELSCGFTEGYKERTAFGVDLGLCIVLNFDCCFLCVLLGLDCIQTNNIQININFYYSGSHISIDFVIGLMINGDAIMKGDDVCQLIKVLFFHK